MRVLVTGAGGFIGSHLCEALVEKGHDVRAFVSYNSQNYWGWLEHSPFKNEMEIIPGDMRDFDSIGKVMQDVDHVYHLAAFVSIPYSHRSQDAFEEVNVKGTLNLLQAALQNGVKKVMHTSTSEVYGTAQYVPIDENHPMNPQSPYAGTKAGGDCIAMSFHKSFDLPVAIVRPFNTYGPRQSARAVIPAIMVQLLSGKKEVHLGALHPTRDLVFVKDTVRAFMAVAASDKTIGEVCNVSTQSEISIKDLAEKLIEQAGNGARVVTDERRLRPHNSEVERLLGCNDKIRKLTDWSPTYSLDDGLKETAIWLKQNLERYKTDIYNV